MKKVFIALYILILITFGDFNAQVFKEFDPVIYLADPNSYNAFVPRP